MVVPSHSNPGPWFGNDRDRVHFEGAARLAVPGLRVRAGAGRNYEFDVEVPEYGVVRYLVIEFTMQKPLVPVIRVDGPADSPHRFDDGTLCVWDWRGSAHERWEFRDGLRHLLGLVVEHLFKEAWWRENQEWLGPEAPHGSAKESPRESATKSNDL